jgi:hypothetical protein
MPLIDRKGGKTMAKMHRKKVPQPVGDTELAAQTQRVLAAGRTALGADITDGEQAIAVARAVAGRLATLPPDVRLAERHDLVSLVDDLVQLNARLTAEKTRVERQLMLRSSHAAAERAYRTGETR